MLVPTARCSSASAFGFGPPCYLQQRNLFADSVCYEPDEYRAYWHGQRRKAKSRQSWAGLMTRDAACRERRPDRLPSVIL
jgi:hypothetical protein